MTNSKSLRHQTPSLPGIKAYLQTHGWRELEAVGPNVNVKLTIYLGPPDVQGKPIVIALPSRPDSSDAKFLLDRAARILSVLEAKPQDVIVREIDGAAGIDRGSRTRRVLSKRKKSPRPTVAA